MIKNCNQTERSNTFFFTSKFLLIITLITIFVNSINISVLGAKTISQKEQEDVIKIVCERLDKVFAFPEKTKNICDGLHQNLKDGNYLNCTTPEEFADQLNNDLMKLSQDKHLGIMYDPQMAAEMKEEEKKEDGDAYLTPQMIEEERLNNFGFKKLEILPENIGYMDLRIFFAPQYAGKTAVAAMDFLSNCDAIIIDLRNNGGGWDEMVTLLMSYFFKSDEIITFSTSYSRFEDEYYQSRTLPYVPGKILSDTPLFLLTSRSTFSGAEAFAHYMKHFNKATIVGEGTRGRQSPVEIQAINDGFIIFYTQLETYKKRY